MRCRFDAMFLLFFEFSSRVYADYFSVESVMPRQKRWRALCDVCRDARLLRATITVICGEMMSSTMMLKDAYYAMSDTRLLPRVRDVLCRAALTSLGAQLPQHTRVALFAADAPI